ncbi:MULTISPECIES: YeeE/YedE family protein [Psychrobacter]|uniref:YeeE/YedE family protein n=1 Tax=Psychrobacter TaxID=497 RepID=UPI00146E44A3|nr:MULTISPECIES: YeeE/YedE family protein [Psychrobacter]
MSKNGLLKNNISKSNFLKNSIGLISGLLFGVGLILSQMVNPEKVLGFLNVFGAWDISLALVMGGALMVSVVGVYIAKHNPKNLIGEPIVLPNKTVIDKPLIFGAALFGIGWGIAGICPAPALVLLGTGQWQALVFVVAMVVGIIAYQQIIKPKLS